MDIRKAFPSKYLRATDVAACPGGTVRLRIVRMAVERMRARQGAEEAKPVLYFETAKKAVKKGLVVNRTISDVLGGAFGWESDDWKGHTVELYTAEVEAFGEMVDAIRVRVPKQGAGPTTPPAPPPEPTPERTFDEEPTDPEPGDLDADGLPF